MVKQKYYKVVTPDSDGKLRSGRHNIVYTPQKWKTKASTPCKTPFFVFTELEAAINYAEEHDDIWECQVDKAFTNDKELGDISEYKDNAAFANKVMLTKRVKKGCVWLSEEMYFRVKNSNQYVQVDSSNTDLLYVGGPNHEEVYGDLYDCDFVEEVEQKYGVVYCPGIKLEIKITTKVVKNGK